MKNIPDLFLIPESLISENQNLFLKNLEQKIASIQLIPGTEKKLKGLIFGALSTQKILEKRKILENFSQTAAHIQSSLSIPYTQEYLQNTLAKTAGASLSFKPESQEILNKNLNKNLSNKENLELIKNINIQILVVDDNDHNRLLLLKTLEKFKIQAHGVSSGKAAIQWISEHPTDLIFMDIQMPDMDGFTTTQKIREIPQGQAIKIFALSADVSKAEQKKIKESGLDGYYLKPIAAKDLISLISSCSAIFQNSVPLMPSSMNQDPELNNKANKADKAELDLLLKTQIQQLPETQGSIEQAFADKNYEKLLQIIHKFHGGLCYIDLPELREATKNAEKALKNDPINLENLSTLIHDLLENIRATQNAYRPK